MGNAEVNPDKKELLRKYTNYQLNNLESNTNLLLDLEFCKQNDCVGLRWNDNTLIVATPKKVKFSLSTELENLGISFEFVECTENELADLIKLLESKRDNDVQDFLGLNSETSNKEFSIPDLVDSLIVKAVLSRASDLHIEPFETNLKIRIRVDGLLSTIYELPANLASGIASRIKVLSQLNIVEKRRPQDGQFRTLVGSRRVDVRVATAATLYGEKIVMRLHDERRPLVTLNELGMRQEQLKSFTRSIMSVNGLILAAGPTGSGKTTTLHSAVQALNSPYKNVTTIEDPVEYIVPTINQIPVSDSSGTGFAVQLRAILRQDPDVILVGETRDAETARISIQAALTGHLVLTTIHATDAVGAVYRLLQMDIEPHLVASSLRTVVSQRLLRKICKFCREQYLPTKKEIMNFDNVTKTPKLLSRGNGCVFCNGSGYLDRVAVYQLLEITENLAELISSRPDPVQFRKIANDEGLTTLSHEALLLVANGITTLTEALGFIDQNE